MGIDPNKNSSIEYEGGGFGLPPSQYDIEDEMNLMTNGNAEHSLNTESEIGGINVSDITKSKIDLKNFPDKEEAIAMILTLAKQYGLWSDQDYETIQKELQEVFATESYEKLLDKFDEYFSSYVEFINDPRKST